MKKLFEFTYNKEVETPKTEISKNESGEEVQTTRKVKENVPQKLFLRKPNRVLNDQAEVYYSSEVAKGIRAGMMSNVELAKRYANDGGVFSEPEKEKYTKALADYFVAKSELDKLEDTEENKAAREDLNVKMIKSTSIIRDFEFGKQMLFDKTAESRALNNTVLWWALNISYQENSKGEYIPFFGEGETKDRFIRYDEICEEEQDSFNMKVLQCFLCLISAWACNKDVGEKELKEVFDMFIKDINKPKESGQS